MQLISCGEGAVVQGCRRAEGSYDNGAAANDSRGQGTCAPATCVSRLDAPPESLSLGTTRWPLRPALPARRSRALFLAREPCSYHTSVPPVHPIQSMPTVTPSSPAHLSIMQSSLFWTEVSCGSYPKSTKSTTSFVIGMYQCF